MRPRTMEPGLSSAVISLETAQKAATGATSTAAGANYHELGSTASQSGARSSLRRSEMA